MTLHLLCPCQSCLKNKNTLIRSETHNKWEIHVLDNIVNFAGISTFINYSPAYAWQWALAFWLGGKICAHAAWVCSSLFWFKTLTFVGQWLRRVLDVAYLCWRASRTSALSSRPVVASQYTIQRSLRHLHCLGNVRYCSPRCFHPNDLPSLADGTFPHEEVKLTGHKKLTFGVAKVLLVSTVLF